MRKGQVARQVKTGSCTKGRMIPAQDSDEIVREKWGMDQRQGRGSSAPEGQVQCAVGQLLQGRGPDGGNGNDRPWRQVLQSGHKVGQQGLGGKIAGSKVKAGPVASGIKAFAAAGAA